MQTIRKNDGHFGVSAEILTVHIKIYQCHDNPPRYRINGNVTISQNIPAALVLFGHGLFKMCRGNEMQSLPTSETGSIDADASAIMGQFSLDI